MPRVVKPEEIQAEFDLFERLDNRRFKVTSWSRVLFVDKTRHVGFLSESRLVYECASENSAKTLVLRLGFLTRDFVIN